jgi:hypothetical protein
VPALFRPLSLWPESNSNVSLAFCKSPTSPFGAGPFLSRPVPIGIMGGPFDRHSRSALDNRTVAMAMERCKPRTVDVRTSARGSPDPPIPAFKVATERPRPRTRLFFWRLFIVRMRSPRDEDFFEEIPEVFLFDQTRARLKNSPSPTEFLTEASVTESSLLPPAWKGDIDDARAKYPKRGHTDHSPGVPDLRGAHVAHQNHVRPIWRPIAPSILF